jgi:hypothetical protein
MRSSPTGRRFASAPCPRLECWPPANRAAARAPHRSVGSFGSCLPSPRSPPLVRALRGRGLARGSPNPPLPRLRICVRRQRGRRRHRGPSRKPGFRARLLAFGCRPRGMVSPHRTLSERDGTDCQHPLAVQGRYPLGPRVRSGLRSLQRGSFAERDIALCRGRRVREHAGARHALPAARAESNAVRLLSRAKRADDLQRSLADRASRESRDAKDGSHDSRGCHPHRYRRR